MLLHSMKIPIYFFAVDRSTETSFDVFQDVLPIAQVVSVVEIFAAIRTALVAVLDRLLPSVLSAKM